MAFFSDFFLFAHIFSFVLLFFRLLLVLKPLNAFFLSYTQLRHQVVNVVADFEELLSFVEGADGDGGGA